MRWFRMYAEFATDPKVQSMSEAMQRRLAMIFCLHADGFIESAAEEDLLYALHLTKPELVKTQELFEKKGFVEPGTMIPKNWDRRQRPSDTSNERVSRYRERAKRDSNGTVTLHKLKSSDTGNKSRLAPSRDDDRARIQRLEVEQREKETITPLPPEAGGVVESLSEEEFPEFPDWRTTIITIQNGDHTVAETDARKIWGHLWRTWKSKKLCVQFYGQQRWCSAEGWLYAIETAVMQDSTPNHVKFLQKIGMDFDINGPKRVKPLTKGDIGNVKYVPTSQQVPIAGTNQPISAQNLPDDLGQFTEKANRSRALAKAHGMDV